MTKSSKKLTAFVCTLAMLVTMFGFTATSKAQFADPPHTGQVRINCGSTEGYLPEQYLSSQNGSVAATDTVYQHRMTKRYADGTGYFTYHIPVSVGTPAPLYLSMVTKGEVKLSVDGTVMLNTGNSGEGNYTAREITLGNSALWSDGYVDLRFEDADPGDGWGPNVYWVELGATSTWRERAKHILWDTSGVLWQTGYYDGFSSEFLGSVTDFTVGGDISTLKNSGTLYLRWNQTVVPGKKYYLLAGIMGGSGTNYIDMKNDGSSEIARGANRERIYDLDVTSQVAATGNVAKIQMATGATLDFAALIEVTPGSTADSDLRVVFKGDEMAQNWTKLVNTTMYWNNDYFVDKGTGFIDASFPRGIFYGGYWVADAGPTVLELAKWGYYDLAKQASNYYANVADYYNSDNGAAGLIFATMAYLMKTDNYTGAYTADTWPKLKAGLDYYSGQIDTNPYHMVMGNNWETTSNGYGIYNNSIAYFALLAGAEAASRTGHASDAANWNSHAATLFNNINTYLKTTADVSWLGKTIPANTFRYGLSTSGGNVSECHAGWFGVGNQEELFYGMKGNAIPDWRTAVNTMLDYHSSNFWSDWKAYGHNRGFGTDYGVLSERGGWPVSAMLMGDRMDMVQKNMNHIIYNSTDLNFANDNEGVQETSPWVLVREVDKDDDGITGADVGNGGEVEDMNLVEYIITMKNVRLMAGIDDALSGSGNLVVMPRIPENWKGAKVNRWPVVYKNGSANAKTEVTYDYSLSPLQAGMNISAANSIPGVQLRFGPFKSTASVSSVTANGSPVSYTTQDSGGYKWVWVTQDVGTAGKNIVVNVTIPDLYANADFNSGGLAGWTAAGGTWTNTGNCAQVVTSGDAWSTYGTTAADVNLSADVRIINGNAVGLTFRNDGAGSSGYDLILDVQDNLLKLCKRPYTVLASMPVKVKRNRTYTLKVEASGSNIKCYLDGVKAFEITDFTYSSGKFGMFGYASTAQVDNLLAYQAAPPDFATNLSGWSPLSGNWKDGTGGKQGSGSGDIFTLASDTGTNFTYEGDIKLTTNNPTAAALVFRSNADASRCYAANISTENDGTVKLFKFPYSVLGTYAVPINVNTVYHLKVTASGANLQVFFNNSDTPCISVTDSAYANGKFGLNVWDGTAVFQNVNKQ